MVTAEELEEFDEVDLNSYEFKVWKALLERGVSSAGRLSEAAGVPRSRSYDVLESLEKKGFVVMQLGKPIRYIALPPNEVLRRLQKNVEREAEETIEELDGLKGSETLQKLKDLYSGDLTTKDPSKALTHRMGSRRIASHVKNSLQTAESTVKLATAHQSFYDKSAMTASLTKAIRRDVEVHILAKTGEEPVIPGATVRHHDKEKVEFIIIDDETVFLFLNSPDQTEVRGMGISARFFAKSLSSLFDAAWENADSPTE